MAAGERKAKSGDRVPVTLPADWQAADGARGHSDDTSAFERFGGICAIFAGLGGLAYAVAFVVVSRISPELGGFLSALLLLVNGMLSASAMVAIYCRVRATDAAFALLALAFALAGNFGAVLHGGYDLANAIHPPALPNPDLPSPVDPRGLATFGLVGLAVFVISWLMARSPGFPRSLSRLGYALAVLLIVLYLSRLVILTPTSPAVLVPVLVTGFAVDPAWYMWLGITLRRGADDSK